MQDFSHQLIIQIKPNVYMNIILINKIELISLFHEKKINTVEKAKYYITYMDSNLFQGLVILPIYRCPLITVSNFTR